jgi:hypothetical protein
MGDPSSKKMAEAMARKTGDKNKKNIKAVTLFMNFESF